MDLAIELAFKNGFLVVSAAGNAASNSCNYSPAGSAYSLTVGNINESDLIGPHSNYGKCVNLFAPGNEIISTSNGQGSMTMSGTSMSAPHVTGIAALLWANNRQLSVSSLKDKILKIATGNQIRNIKNGSPNLIAYNIF